MSGRTPHVFCACCWHVAFPRSHRVVPAMVPFVLCVGLCVCPSLNCCCCSCSNTSLLIYCCSTTAVHHPNGKVTHQVQQSVREALLSAPRSHLRFIGCFDVMQWQLVLPGALKRALGAGYHSCARKYWLSGLSGKVPCTRCCRCTAVCLYLYMTRLVRFKYSYVYFFRLSALRVPQYAYFSYCPLDTRTMI